MRRFFYLGKAQPIEPDAQLGMEGALEQSKKPFPVAKRLQRPAPSYGGLLGMTIAPAGATWTVEATTPSSWSTESTTASSWTVETV